MSFNPHNNVTADGVLIVVGLRVITNEMKHGVITADTNADSYSCCKGVHTNDAGLKPGQIHLNGGWFTDHQAASKLKCDQYCGHNHWFFVELDDGGASRMDGERVATRFNGVKA